MKTALRRTHVVIPEGLVSAIDGLVGKRGRSRFLIDAAERELRRLAQVRALEEATGRWKAEDHPELEAGAAAWVRSLRADRDVPGTTRRRLRSS